MLYAYALLDTVSEDYEEHIKNKAILSCLKTEPAGQIAEKIAWEILEKRVLETFKGKVEAILSTLTEVERTLICIRFLGKERDRKAQFLAEWGERKYFRAQARLLNCLSARFERAGLTGEYFDEELAGIDIFAKVIATLRRKKARRGQSSS